MAFYFIYIYIGIYGHNYGTFVCMLCFQGPAEISTTGNPTNEAQIVETISLTPGAGAKHNRKACESSCSIPAAPTSFRVYLDAHG